MKKVGIEGPGVVIDKRRLDDASLQNSGNNNMCVSWGDPHFKTFNGKTFNNYKLGDYLLLRTPRLSISVRQRRWGSAAVNTLFAAKINGVIIEADRPDYFLLNKKERIPLKVGQSMALSHGGKIERVEGDRWFIISNKAGYIDVRFYYYGGNLKVGNTIYQRRYMNFIIKVPHPKKATGFCVGKMMHSSHLFSTPYIANQIPFVMKAISKKM